MGDHRHHRGDAFPIRQIVGSERQVRVACEQQVERFLASGRLIENLQADSGICFEYRSHIRNNLGVLAAIRATSRFLWNDEELHGKTVALLGVGKVGTDLVRRLHENGCKITVADVYPPSLERVRSEYGVDVVEPDEIFDVECDIFSPCSLGGVFTEETVARLRTQAVVGCANNQLLTPEDGDRMAERGILYAPDFVVNAGGLINVNEELRGYTVDKAAAHIDKIYDNTLRVLETSRERGMTPVKTAIALAEERIHEIGNLRLFRRSGDDRN